MKNKQIDCRRCTGTMVRGYIPDFSQAAYLLLNWHEGHPEKSFWTTTKVKKDRGIPIGAYRCRKCGCLALDQSAGLRQLECGD